MRHDGSALTDLVLKYANQCYKQLYLCMVDVSKAFDSVSHGAIFELLKAFGAPESLLQLIRRYYTKSFTSIVEPDWEGRSATRLSSFALSL